MRLKRIELAGFKSFVDPIKIELGDGVTAIVGPNGCGKSNIVDAIRWVLGEHSAKHLRGGIMDDLIFQGSDARPPVAICDVELTFAIDPGQLPSPYHELDEIRIRRRLTREGGSDAFINGKMVRLKDVVDLFLDTGVSTHAYAVVEQGSIARMITAKPEERRIMLEEAAGVMKYRARRREAERKIKDTRQNLERVKDLLEEVSTQCRSLRQQASRAERFRKLQDEWQDTQALAMGIRYQQCMHASRQAELSLEEAKALETEASGSQVAAERRLTQARDAMVAHEHEAQDVQDKLRAAEQKRAELQQQAERLAGDRRLLAERKTMLAERIEGATGRSAEIAAELEALAGKMEGQDDAGLVSRREQAQAVADAAQKQYADQLKQREQLIAAFERLKSEHDSDAMRQEQAQAALARLALRKQAILAQQQELMQGLEKTETALKQSEDGTRKAEAGLAEAEAGSQKAEELLELRHKEREQAGAKLSASEALVRRLAGEVQEMRARLGSPELPAELRQQMRKQGGVWVDESLQVPEGLELAVAAALRGQEADVRIPANPGLAAWNDAIRRSQDVPIAFFAGNQTEAMPNNLAEAVGLTGEHPLHAIFSNVLVVDDILKAPSLLANKPGCAAAVSRDGWRMEQSGWLVPPAHKRAAQRLSLQRDLRGLEQKLAQAVKTHAQLGEKLEQADKALAQQQTGWQQAHLTVTQAQGALHASQDQIARHQAELADMRARLLRINEERGDMEAETQRWQTATTGKEETDPARMQEAQLRLEAQTSDQHEAEVRLNDARMELAAAEQTLALQQQTLDALTHERQRLQEESERLGGQLQEDRERIERTEQALSQAEQQTEMDRMLGDAAGEVERQHQQLNELRQQGHALLQNVHEAEKSERQARQKLADHLEQRQQAEVSLAMENTRLHDLSDEIQQRCHRSADTLLQKIDAMQEPLDEEAILAQARQLEERLTRFGPVNLLAIDEYEQASEREQFLSEQAADLEASLQTLADTISRIDRTTKSRFRDAFERTNAIFQQTFPRLFGGGRAELRLDSEDALTAGVEVIAQPPGKRLQDVSLLSGGEKALTAVALVLSIFRMKPAPFCILDEVDAPLDDANVGRFGDMVRELASTVQFLAITHNKITIQMANRIVGVSMPEPGVSRIVGVDVEQYEVAAVNA